jgi:ribosomal protein S18 acetylase RimI-like enzyme
MMASMADPRSIVVRELRPDEQSWKSDTLQRDWGSTKVARRGELVDAAEFPAYVAEIDGESVGLAVVVGGDQLEVLSITSSVRGSGVGRALLERCFADARAAGCTRVWLMTTNDNIAAIAF